MTSLAGRTYCLKYEVVFCTGAGAVKSHGNTGSGTDYYGNPARPGVYSRTDVVPRDRDYVAKWSPSGMSSLHFYR